MQKLELFNSGLFLDESELQFSNLEVMSAGICRQTT